MLKAVNTELVHAIILLHRAFREQDQLAHEDASGETQESAFDGVMKFLADPTSFPLKTGLWMLIDSLSNDQRLELLVLMYSGRGDGTFSALLPKLRGDKELVKHAGSQMVHKVWLSRYLNDGLKELGLPTVPDPQD